MHSANLVDTWSSCFKCPLCGSPVRVDGHASLVCSKHHAFDFSKHGYLNLLTRPVVGKYGKSLFEARHHLITESSLYRPLHKALRDVILKDAPEPASPWMMADLGCGEGSHLQSVLKACDLPQVTGLGLDISKEGITLAAKRYEGSIWLVGDLAGLPLADQSCRVLLNILSPANYKEFTRILKQDGSIVKVVPGPGYLKELRQALHGDNEKRNYSNEHTIDLFCRHFDRLDTIQLNYRQRLSGAELQLLASMTPLAWSADPERLRDYVRQESAWVTVELDILVGKSRRTGRK